jgi:hypothetical protein
MVNPEYLAWCRRDQTILSVLISTHTEPYVVDAVGCATTIALWTTLVTMFASQARAHVMQIYFQLATVKKGNNSITEYFQTIKTLSDTLASAGQPLNDFESVSFLLKGIGSEFDPFVTSVTTRVSIRYPLMSYMDIFLRMRCVLSSNFWPLILLNLLQIFLLSLQYLEAEAIVAVDHLPPMVDGHYYHGRGSSSNNRGRGSYFSNDATSSSRPTCQFCGKLGHTAPAQR